MPLKHVGSANLGLIEQSRRPSRKRIERYGINYIISSCHIFQIMTWHGKDRKVELTSRPPLDDGDHEQAAGVRSMEYGVVSLCTHVLIQNRFWALPSRPEFSKNWLHYSLIISQADATVDTRHITKGASLLALHIFVKHSKMTCSPIPAPHSEIRCLLCVEENFPATKR